MVIWLKQNVLKERASLITNTADGKVLRELKEKYHVEEPAVGHSRLKILDVQLWHSGMFICKQSNADDNIDNMTLTVAGRPHQIVALHNLLATSKLENKLPLIEVRPDQPHYPNP